MDSPELETAKAFMEAINRHDLDAMSDLMTDDHTFVDSGGTITSGRDTMTAGWKDFFHMFPDYENRVEKLLGDKAVVAAFGSASGTWNGKRGLVEENRIAMPAAWMAIVENGKIKHW